MFSLNNREKPSANATPTRPRLLVLGQAVHPTGYARVIHSLMEQLCNDFAILHFGINYRGAPLDCGWRIEPNQLVGDIFGTRQLPAIIARFRPALIFICHDYWLYAMHQQTLRLGPDAAPVVFYCPMEYPTITPQQARVLATADRLVMYTEFGRRVVAEALHKHPDQDVEMTGAPTEVLPHGVDSDHFYPLLGAATPAALTASRLKARRILFPDRPDLEHGFIVLNANRNCPRKRVDLTLQAFAEFASDKSDIWLYLHMGMQDSGVDVLGIARELGIADRLLITSSTPEKPEVPDQQLNLIYNACDVGLNTAAGEGWGLVAFEHAATGAAQIVPNHSACAELWQGHGLLAPLDAPAAELKDPATDGAVSASGVAALLSQLYQNRQLLVAQQHLAYTYATSPQFNWKNIAQRWAQLFSQLISPAA